MNFFDILQVQGKHQSKPAFPWMAGSEYAGVISASSPIPPGCSLIPGKSRVFGSGLGAFAEQIAVDWKTVLPMTDNMTFEEAAGLSVTYALVDLFLLTSCQQLISLTTTAPRTLHLSTEPTSKQVRTLRCLTVCGETDLSRHQRRIPSHPCSSWRRWTRGVAAGESAGGHRDCYRWIARQARRLQTCRRRLRPELQGRGMANKSQRDHERSRCRCVSYSALSWRL